MLLKIETTVFLVKSVTNPVRSLSAGGAAVPISIARGLTGSRISFVRARFCVIVRRNC